LKRLVRGDKMKIRKWMNNNEDKPIKIRNKLQENGGENMELLIEDFQKDDLQKSTDNKFSDIYTVGEQFAKLLGIKDSKDVCKILKKK
jgi:hypothetical protein